MNPLIESFLAANGEAVVRGIIGTLAPAQRRGLGGSSVFNSQLVWNRLNEKGYDLPPADNPEFRQLLRAANASFGEAQAANRSAGRSVVGANAPNRPGTAEGRMLHYTMVVTVHEANGGTADVVIDVNSPVPLTADRVRQLTLTSLENRQQIVSDPRGASLPGDVVGDIRFSSIYWEDS